MGSSNEKSGIAINVVLWTTAITIIIITSFLIFSLSKSYSLFEGELNINHTGDVGSFFGGVVGSLISLISALLLYTTIRLQRDDLQANVSHNSLQWSTTLIKDYLILLNNNESIIYFTNIQHRSEDDNLYWLIRNNPIEVQKQIVNAGKSFDFINQLVFDKNKSLDEINFIREFVYRSLSPKLFNNLDILIKTSSMNRNVGNNSLAVSMQNVSIFGQRIMAVVGEKNNSEVSEIIQRNVVSRNLGRLRVDDLLRARMQKVRWVKLRSFYNKIKKAIRLE